MHSSKQLKALEKSIEETENVPVRTQLYDGGVIPSIMQATESNQIDLIVMGTLGRTGLRNKIVGSRTAEILSESELPVFLGSPADHRQQTKYNIEPVRM
jgi:nucleotide-binding universal stress UspA family protein